MGLFTWSGGPRSSGVGFFCFHALEDTKQKKVTPLDRGPPLHANRVFVVRKNKFPRPKPGLIEYRSMKNFDNAEFLTELENAPWDSAYCFSDVDDIWGHWSALYKIVLDRHAPVKNGCAVINYPGYHLKFNTKLPGAIDCLNVTGRTQLTISVLRISYSVTKSPRKRERVSTNFVVMQHLMRKVKLLLPNQSSLYQTEQRDISRGWQGSDGAQ